MLKLKINIKEALLEVTQNERMWHQEQWLYNSFIRLPLEEKQLVLTANETGFIRDQVVTNGKEFIGYPFLYKGKVHLLSVCKWSNKIFLNPEIGTEGEENVLRKCARELASNVSLGAEGKPCTENMLEEVPMYILRKEIFSTIYRGYNWIVAKKNQHLKYGLRISGPFGCYNYDYTTDKDGNMYLTNYSMMPVVQLPSDIMMEITYPKADGLTPKTAFNLSKKTNRKTKFKT